MTLLFIEDDDVIRNSLRDYLNTLFDNVYEVSDGKDAFRIYQEVKPDIILLDINLPSVDGITIAKEIRKIDYTTIIIILSAREDKETFLDVMNLGLSKYLLKPVQRKKFRESLMIAIQKIKKDNDCNDSINLKNGFIWNLKKKELFHNSINIKLTKKEMCLLDNFCSKSNKIVSYEAMYLELYNEMEYNENRLRMLIKRFRLKTHQNIIQNIYGFGYKFNID